MRKNVASQTISFQAVSSTDGSAVTTGTPTVYYTVDGGTQGTGGGTSTHEGNGQWSYVPVQAETNGDQVAFTFTLSGAIPQTANVYPVSFDPTDAVRMGMTALPNAAAEAAGGLIVSTLGTTDADDCLTATSIATVTNLTNLPTIPANWLTAAGIAASALDGKGDWNTTTPNTVVPPTVAQLNARTLATADYFDPAADTVANVTTVATLTGHTVQTGDTYALANGATGFDAIDTVVDGLATTIGTAGDGLTSINLPDQTMNITGDITGNLSGTVGSVTGLTVSLIADGVWDEAQSGHVTAGTFGLYLDQTVSTAGGGGLTASAVADAVWDELLSGHAISGSSGEAMSAAGTAGDPWTTSLPGAYGAGTAGYIIGNNSSSVGSGSETYVATVEASGTPVGGVECWITTDEAGTNVVAGSLTTDDFGVVTFLLDVGTYYMWRDSSTHDFPNPTEITVT